jgi:hypothetical protein
MSSLSTEEQYVRFEVLTRATRRNIPEDTIQLILKPSFALLITVSQNVIEHDSALPHPEDTFIDQYIATSRGHLY